MTTYIKSNAIRWSVLALGILASAACQAWHGRVINIGWGGGNTHYHGSRGGYGPDGYYGRGGYYGYYNGGGWIGPNVIINVPAQRFYVPQCENMEVCDSYGQCWIEQYCE